MNSKLVRLVRQLLLSTIILTMGLGTLPMQAQQVSDDQVKALVEAFRQAAPQRAPGNNTLVSEWQIKPENIPRWSKLCTGREVTPAQFESNLAIAQSILACVIRDVLRDEYKASSNNESIAVQRTASWWMTGDPNQYNSNSIAPYTQKVLSFYQQHRNTPPQPATNPPKPLLSGQSNPSPTTPPPAPPPTRTSSSSQVSDAQVGALVEALRLAAPQTGSANDGLYSDWQIKPENISLWSKKCQGKELTPTQFQDSPVTARAILVCVMRDVFREQYNTSNHNESVAVQRTASWWMTGDSNQYNSSSTAPYTQTVLNFYRQSRLKFFSHI